ncbi:subtilase [Plectosphaerella plurivora]|uniref:Subtilase n=1 Tax=Plectosphaerella plurivora TaxID=936078 RepID=A0A9P8V9E8_9PEZI|nr:subtilase [Plectosphaerella plurivora]
MVRFQSLAVSAAALLAGVPALAIAQDGFDPENFDKFVPNTYIVELEDGQAHESYLDALKDESGVDGVTQRFAYGPLFNAVSFEVEGSLTTEPEKLRRRLAELPGYKHIWPVEIIQAPKVVGDLDIFTMDSTKASGAEKSRRQNGDFVFPPHEMIQADRLHAEGYTGNGTRIGVIDSGFDYLHPALGGCYGPGCLIEYGYDLVGEDFNGSPGTLRPDDDPFATCDIHGTLVTGTIAAQENPLGFTGVAPGVKIGAYRVFSCAGASSSDVIIAAIFRAYEDGSDVITLSVGDYSGYTAHPLSVALSRVVEAGVPCVAAAGNSAGNHYGVWSVVAPASGEGVMAVGAVESTLRPSINSETGQVSWAANPAGGLVTGFSLWGPTFEGDFKPQFTAPGGNILTVAPNNGYTVTSGTSFAAPITAASIALLIEARGKLSPSEVRSLLATTAKRIDSGSGLGLEPVAHQGAGIIQVHDAVHATTSVSAEGFAVGDTEHHVADNEFEVVNDSGEAIDYEISHIAALAAEVLWEENGFRLNDPDLVPGAATVKIEPTSFTLQPGAATTVRFSVDQPTGLNAIRLPLYGGFVAIEGSSSASNATAAQSFSVPYQGIAGVVREAGVLAFPEQFFFLRFDNGVENWSPLPPNVIFQLPVPAAHPEWAKPVGTTESHLPLGSLPGWTYWAKIGSPEIRFELVPVTPSCQFPDLPLSTNVMGDETMPINASPQRLVNPNGKFFSWSGRLAGGVWTPPGRYIMRLYALRHFGNPDSVEDWEVLDYKPNFALSYVNP